MKSIKNKVLVFLSTCLILSSCGLSPNNCELAVRKEYDSKSLWIESTGDFVSIVLTKDSVLLKISSRNFTYPYISKIDTLGVFSHK